MVGSEISHYRILERVGAGGMGEVYLAEDQRLHRRVALKLLPEALTRDPNRKRRFLQEARAAAAVEHPHVAAVYDIDEAEGRLFIVMEYVRGQSLRQMLQKGKLPPRRAVDLAIQVTDALAKVHERGLVHRDLKPANVLVSEEGYAKVIDFGLAKLLEPTSGGLPEAAPPLEAETLVKTRDGQILGTTAYLSPEQARGAAVDGRSDVFSVGALLYEMLAGRAPFLRTSVAETLSAVLNEDPPGLSVGASGAPPALERVVKKALAKDPGERYQHMGDLAIDLRELRDEMARGAPFPAARRSRRVRPWVLVATAGVLAALALSLLGDRSRPVRGVGPSGRPAIAVLDFDDHTGAEETRWLSKGVPQMLLTGLAQTPGLDVVGGQRIHDIVKELGQEGPGATDPSRVSEIARKAGAGAVVVGSIFKAGAAIRIDLRVEDVSTGRVVTAQSVTGADLIPLVDELTERIRSGLHLAEAVDARGLSEVTSPSLEAYRFYTEGVTALRHQRHADARTLLLRAVERDPGFAMAYFELSHLATLVGETGAAREFGSKALAHAERLPRRQKLLLDGTHAWMANDPERAVALLEELAGLYPDEEDAYPRLARVYSGLGQPEKAVQSLRRGIEALPTSGSLRNNLGYLYLLYGKYPEGLRELEAYARLSPGEPNAYDSLGEAYLVTGQPERALAKYARALEIDASFRTAHRGRGWAHAMLGRYPEALAEIAREERANTRARFPQSTTRFVKAFMLSRIGRYREAGDEVRQATRDAQSAGDTVLSLSLEVLSSLIALERDDASAALEKARQAERVLRELPELDATKALAAIDLVAGVAEVRTGRLAAARERLGSWGAPGDPLELWWQRALEGEIALATGDLSAADRAFAAGEPTPKMWFGLISPPRTIAGNNFPFRDGRARVSSARSDYAGAIAIYQQLNTPSMGGKWTAMLEPRYVLELARLFRRSGDRASATREYERFLDLWKNADPGLPELAEAKRYLGRS